MNRIKIKFQIIFSLIIGCLLLVVGYAGAQSAPEFLVSWQAVNYVPPSYQGKIFPSRATPVQIGFDLIDKNRIVDLSTNDIQWYLDGEIIQYGKGLKSFLFNSKGIDHEIRIAVLDYQGTRLDKTLTVPGLKPKVVIDARTPDNILGLGTHVLETLPYFFNVSNLQDLSFNWTSDNKPVQGSVQFPQFFILNLGSPGSAPKETDLTISATVRNVFDQSEVGNKKIILKIK